MKSYNIVILGLSNYSIALVKKLNDLSVNTLLIVNDGSELLKSINHLPNLDIMISNYSFADKSTIQTNEGLIIADYFVIDSQKYDIKPNIKGLEKVKHLNINNLNDLKEDCTSVVIQNVNKKSLELAYLLMKNNIKTTLIDSRDSILNKYDVEQSELIYQHLLNSKIDFLLSSSIENVYNTQNGLEYDVNCDGKNFLINSDSFIISYNQTQSIDTLKLENAEVYVNEDGFIKTNNKLQTTNSKVYVIGSTVVESFYSDFQNEQVNHLVKRLCFSNLLSKVKYYNKINSISCYYQIATVGLSLSQAKAIYKDKFKTFKLDFKDNTFVKKSNQKEGSIKIILDRFNRVLGVSAFGLNASEVINQWDYFIRNKKSASALLKDNYNNDSFYSINKQLIDKVYTKANKPCKVMQLIVKLLFKLKSKVNNLLNKQG